MVGANDTLGSGAGGRSIVACGAMGGAGVGSWGRGAVSAGASGGAAAATGEGGAGGAGGETGAESSVAAGGGMSRWERKMLARFWRAPVVVSDRESRGLVADGFWMASMRSLAEDSSRSVGVGAGDFTCWGNQEMVSVMRSRRVDGSHTR